MFTSWLATCPTNRRTGWCSPSIWFTECTPSCSRKRWSIGQVKWSKCRDRRLADVALFLQEWEFFTGLLVSDSVFKRQVTNAVYRIPASNPSLPQTPTTYSLPPPSTSPLPPSKSPLPPPLPPYSYHYRHQHQHCHHTITIITINITTTTIKITTTTIPSPLPPSTSPSSSFLLPLLSPPPKLSLPQLLPPILPITFTTNTTTFFKASPTIFLLVSPSSLICFVLAVGVDEESSRQSSVLDRLWAGGPCFAFLTYCACTIRYSALSSMWKFTLKVWNQLKCVLILSSSDTEVRIINWKHYVAKALLDSTIANKRMCWIISAAHFDAWLQEVCLLVPMAVPM